MRLTSLAIGTAIVLIALSGCTPPDPGDDYFPLGKGLRWHYKVEKALFSGNETHTFTLQNLGPVILPGRDDETPLFQRRSSDGTVYYILRDREANYRVAKRTVVEYLPRFDAEERMVLPLNSEITTGRNWNVSSQPYALQTVPLYDTVDPGDKLFNLNYEIVATDAVVEVPAGRFERCVKVVAQATLTVYADAEIGFTDVPITQTEWYAPGVGLVKLLREEPLESGIFKGGSINFELIEFSRH